jgi:plastocyanin
MMNFLSTALLFSSLPLIHAQSGNGVHTIDVGEDGLSFNPASLTVAPGDKVEFHFYPPNHSVVQASFANPCQPISSGGFFSGFFKTTEESVSSSNYNEPKICG